MREKRFDFSDSCFRSPRKIFTHACIYRLNEITNSVLRKEQRNKSRAPTLPKYTKPSCEYERSNGEIADVGTRANAFSLQYVGTCTSLPAFLRFQIIAYEAAAIA